MDMKIKFVLKSLIYKKEFELEDLVTSNYLMSEWLKMRNECTPVLHVPELFANLRQCSDTILNEYQSYLSQGYYLPRYAEINEQQAASTDTDTNVAWRTLHLRIFGRDTNVLSLFPQTLACIEKTGLKVPTIIFSTLEPGKKIPPHTGYYCGVLRYHLGLVIPSSEDCFIEIDGKRYGWNPDLYFDDTFIHSAENNTNEHRIVLFLDIVRDFGDKEMNIYNQQLLEKINQHPILTHDVAQVNVLTNVLTNITIIN